MIQSVVQSKLGVLSSLNTTLSAQPASTRKAHDSMTRTSHGPSVRTVLKSGAMLALALPKAASASPTNNVHNLVARDVCDNVPPGKTSNPACEPITINNVGDGCTVQVTFVPDPGHHSFVFSGASSTFQVHHSQLLTLDAQPQNSGFGPASWTGTTSTSSPTNFTADPHANGQTLTVTCAPVCEAPGGPCTIEDFVQVCCPDSNGSKGCVFNNGNPEDGRCFLPNQGF